jgi:hypothetical protein
MVFAQEKLGLKVTTELGLGDLANPDFAKPFTSGGPADADFIAGSANWTIPKFEFSRTAGKWTFDAMGKLVVSSSKTVNAPAYAHGDGSVKFTYLIATGMKVWWQIGDGVDLKPGFSYASGPVTAQIEIPLGGLFTNPIVKLEPKVSYGAGSFGASLKGVFALVDVTEVDEVDDDGWTVHKQAENTSFVQGLEAAANYTAGPVKIEATFYFPLYTNWALDPKDMADLGMISSDVFDPLKGFSGKGIKITPKVTYTAGDLSVYASVEIGNIGINSDLIDYFDDQDLKLGASIKPTIGVSYAF